MREPQRGGKTVRDIPGDMDDDRVEEIIERSDRIIEDGERKEPPEELEEEASSS